MRSGPSRGLRTRWLGTIIQGWAYQVQGQSEEGITEMRQGLAAYGLQGQS